MAIYLLKTGKKKRQKKCKKTLKIHYLCYINTLTIKQLGSINNVYDFRKTRTRK